MRVAVPLGLSPRAIQPRGGTAVEFGGPTMGVSWSVRALAPAELDASGAQSQIQGLLDRIVRQMSTWEPEADISRFNRLPAGGWMEAPAAFRHVLERGLYWAQESGGAFDPTAGALVDLWGFGAAGAVDAPPNDAQIKAALAASGWDRLAVDGARVHQPGGLQLDFSGIAKGFGVDEVSRALSLMGLTDHLVEIGGELRGAGVKTDGSPWWVEIAPPPGAALPGGRILVALHGLSVATSGDYRRRFEHAGRIYSHSIDPRTGRPVVNGLRSVSVIAPDCIDADALCTALTVLGAQEGLDFATRNDVAAHFLVERAGRLEEFSSPALTAMLG
ncbi:MULTISPECIES: FAD:protein FMN transferase [Phenylobacterium]|uniref:FAD:protein FMN transferase n=1 Tax=Phenylobacterium TaxID=20 RepID=UPI002F92CB97